MALGGISEWTLRVGLLLPGVDIEAPLNIPLHTYTQEC